MKRFLLLAVLGALSLLGNKAQAQEAQFSKGYSTWTVTGVSCTSGTAVNISSGAAIQGFTTGAFRITNQDTIVAAWFSATSIISTAALSGLGEKLAAGAVGVWELGRNNRIPLYPQVDLWCKAADAAGTAGVTVSVATFAYP